jgi:sec-independent protein translocase protein TatA
VFGNVGWPELVIVLVIVLLIFGAKRLPEIGRSLGGGMREFKDSISGKEPPEERILAAQDAPPTPPEGAKRTSAGDETA